ncbi:MAG: hypothetical protein JWM11_6350, partial [Planctomycetaceae bacterium]|nr:hypothetical protein [Planctomycetaceae bacterium]
MSIKFGALPVLAMLDPSSMVTTKTSPEILPKVR